MPLRDFIVDFETRCHLNLKEVGMYRYIEEAVPLCVCWKEIGEDPIFVESIDFMNEDGYLRRVRDFIELCKDPEVIFHAHNAQFEMLCFYKFICSRFKIPRIPGSRFRCTAAAARQKALPGGLDQLGEALGLNIVKDKVGAKAMLKLSLPKGVDMFGDPEYHPATPEAMATVIDYCAQDVLAEEAAYEIVGSLPPMEQSIFLLDFQINTEGVPLDTDLCKAALCTWEVFQESQNKRIAELTNGEITSYTQAARLPAFASSRGFQLADATAETIDSALDEVKDEVLKEVLQIRRDTAKTSIAKFDKMLEVNSERSRARGCHIYHVATTGRWAGALIQLQNIARGKIPHEDLEAWVEALLSSPGQGFIDYCDMFGMSVGDALSSLIRQAIHTKDRFIVGDFAGVEARGVAWLFGQDDLVRAFRDREDVYKLFAGENIYNIPVGSVNKDQRFVGKQAVLGCGYGMGADRFKEQCEGYGVTLERDFCQQVIQAYRIRYSKISAGWRAVEAAAVNAVKSPGKFYCCNRKIYFELITIKGHRFLTCGLPARRLLYYPEPDLEPGRFGNDAISFAGIHSKTKKWCRETTYGGKLTENIVQAICRDLLAGSLFRLVQAGYNPIMHIHDEIVCEVPKRSEHTLEGMLNLMRVVPAWAEGFPIEVEGFESQRYRK